MPTRKLQTSCPNCRQPVIVEVEQLFDLNEDPQAKQRLLSGAANLLRCPHCGYQGTYSTPLVYHDPEKELLLTFVPPELGLSMDDQQRVVGPLINQVVNRLPQEQRKAYLLQPKTMLTYQKLIETILEADGITREMLDAQQERLNLLQRLANIRDEEALVQVAQQEDALIDQEFFELLNRMVESALAGGNQPLAQRLVQVQELILPVTTYGQELQQQSQEVAAAIEALQALGQEITREKLLDLIVKAPNDTRIEALVSLARGGMDYEFFRLLSQRIDRARGEGRARLAALREKLLKLTQEYDQRLEEQMNQMRQFLDAILQTDNIREALLQNAPAINELFLQVAHNELEAARRAGDLDRSGKIQQILDTIRELTAPPPEVSAINDLLSAPDEETRQQMLESFPQESVSGLVETLTGLVGQVEASGDQNLTERVQEVYRQVLRHSMRLNLRK